MIAVAPRRRGPKPGPRPEPLEVRLGLTPDQARDFARCARVAGLDLDQWIVECAAVQAANAIDAMQATARRARAVAAAENEAVNAPIRARRKAKRRAEETSQ